MPFLNRWRQWLHVYSLNSAARDISKLLFTFQGLYSVFSRSCWFLISLDTREMFLAEQADCCLSLPFWLSVILLASTFWISLDLHFSTLLLIGEKDFIFQALQFFNIGPMLDCQKFLRLQKTVLQIIVISTHIRPYSYVLLKLAHSDTIVSSTNKMLTSISIMT